MRFCLDRKKKGRKVEPREKFGVQKNATPVIEAHSARPSAVACLPR
jgi:hypothetical protein